jgi:hypothetical protein
MEKLISGLTDTNMRIFCLPFYEVWSPLEDIDTKITQADASPEMLTDFGTPYNIFFMKSEAEVES